MSFFWWYVISCLSFCWSSLVFFFVLPAEAIWSAILFPVKSPVASDVYWTTLLDVVFAASIPGFVAVFINFLPYLLPNLFANDKNPYRSTCFLSFGSIEYLLNIQLLGSY